MKPWSEYDERVVAEWQRRRAAYASSSKALRIVLVASVVALVIALLLPFASAPAKIGMWLLFFGAVFVFDQRQVLRQLRCPACESVPFLSSRFGGLVSSSYPSRCHHCGKVLSGNAAQPVLEGPTSPPSAGPRP
jgi:hypothetical protein